MLRLLEERGRLRHTKEGQKYMFLPSVPRNDARRKALAHVVSTFFEGSIEQTMLTLVESSRSKLSTEEVDRLAEIVKRAKKGEASK